MDGYFLANHWEQTVSDALFLFLLYLNPSGLSRGRPDFLCISGLTVFGRMWYNNNQSALERVHNYVFGGLILLPEGSDCDDLDGVSHFVQCRLRHHFDLAKQQ